MTERPDIKAGGEKSQCESDAPDVVGMAIDGELSIYEENEMYNRAVEELLALVEAISGNEGSVKKLRKKLLDAFLYGSFRGGDAVLHHLYMTLKRGEVYIKEVEGVPDEYKRMLALLSRVGS